MAVSIRYKEHKILKLANVIRSHSCPTGFHAVPGEGNVGAKIIFVGEGPGKEEERLGRPFVGRAGKFLDKQFSKLNIRREDIYITNIVRCRPVVLRKTNKTRGKYWSINKKALLRMYSKEKKTIDKIAKSFGVSKPKVKYYLDRYKIRRLKRWERYPVKLSRLQKEYLYGSVLGDDFLRKTSPQNLNASLQVCHSSKFKDYVFWKYKILKAFVSGDIKKYSINLNGRTHFALKFNTVSHPEFTKIYQEFYINGKKTISRKILNKLTPLSLAVWYMDDGSYVKTRGRALLATNAFTHVENKIIQKYFSEVWNLNCNIGTSDRGTSFIWFNTENTMRFFEIISKYIHPQFYYKIDKNRKLMFSKLSQDELQYIKNNYGKKSVQYISDKLNRSESSILRAAHKFGLTERGRL